MKKGNWIIALTLAAALSLAGCGAAPEEPAATATPEPTVTAVPTAEPTSEPTEEPTAEPPRRIPPPILRKRAERSMPRS